MTLRIGKRRLRRVLPGGRQDHVPQVVQSGSREVEKLHPILEEASVKGVGAGWEEMCDRVTSTMRSFIYGCIMVPKSHFCSFCAQQFLVGLAFNALPLAPLRPDRHRKGSQGLGSRRAHCKEPWIWRPQARLQGSLALTDSVTLPGAQGASLGDFMGSCGEEPRSLIDLEQRGQLLWCQLWSPGHTHSFSEVVHGCETVCILFLRITCLWQS